MVDFSGNNRRHGGLPLAADAAAMTAVRVNGMQAMDFSEASAF
jgi:hypothetical protein